MTLLEMLNEKDNYLSKIKQEWLLTSHLFPDFLPEISKETKLENELYIQTFSKDLEKQMKRYSRIPLTHKKWRHKTSQIIENVLYHETIIGIHKSMNQQTIDTFQEDLKEFLRNVRSFAPEFSFIDIGQAIRNYIVYAMFKGIHQKESGFHMACFGYSMLYPVTDNFIDSKMNSPKDKQEYNQIIRDKIEGKEVHPKSPHQLKTCELLQAIETQYPRISKPEIYQLLLMMLEAQEISISQQNKDLSLTLDNRLDISIYKGGISVLIDRYFVDLEITEEDFIFYLTFGFFLQLADDLQDIKEDSLLGNQTIFTLELHSAEAEKIVNKMLHLVHHLFSTYQAPNDDYKYFILTNCYLLMYTSVIGSKEFFSNEYLKNIEKYLPTSFPFLENLLNNRIENKDRKLQNKYIHILDEMLR